MCLGKRDQKIFSLQFFNIFFFSFWYGIFSVSSLIFPQHHENYKLCQHLIHISNSFSLTDVHTTCTDRPRVYRNSKHISFPLEKLCEQLKMVIVAKLKGGNKLNPLIFCSFHSKSCMSSKDVIVNELPLVEVNVGVKIIEHFTRHTIQNTNILLSESFNRRNVCEDFWL